MNKTTEALAMEALNRIADKRNVHFSGDAQVVACEALAAIREALAEPVKQEPVAMVVSKYGDPESFGERELEVLIDIQALPYDTPFYASPVERQWVDLTDDEIDEAYEQAGKALRRWQSSVHGQTVSPADLLNTHFAWAVIAAFKEKNK